MLDVFWAPEVACIYLSTSISHMVKNKRTQLQVQKKKNY